MQQLVEAQSFIENYGESGQEQSYSRMQSCAMIGKSIPISCMKDYALINAGILLKLYLALP